MLNLVLSIQNAMYQHKLNKLRQSAESTYIQHINDISHLHEMIFRFDLTDARIDYHMKCARNSLRQYISCVNMIKNNCKIGRPCIWMPTNVTAEYSLDELNDQIKTIGETLRSEIRICRKKIYRRLGSRARSHSY